MVAGDSKKNLKNICSFLENLHMNPIIATSGSEAIRSYKQHFPDILFVDENLEDIEVSRFVLKIRELEKCKDDTTIILVTKANSEADLMQTTNYGINDYILQPISEFAFKFQVIAIQQHMKMRDILNDINCKIKNTSQIIQNISERNQ